MAMKACLTCGAAKPANYTGLWWEILPPADGSDSTTYRFCSIECISGDSIINNPYPTEETG